MHLDNSRRRLVWRIALALSFYVLGFCLARCATGAEPPGPNHYRISAVAVHDGDTLKADIHLGFDVTLSRQSVRLVGFDAWEISRVRRTVELADDELARGQAAREALVRLLAAGTPYLVPEGRGRDNYGRILARLVIVTEAAVVDVAEQMRAAGHDRDHPVIRQATKP